MGKVLWSTTTPQHFTVASEPVLHLYRSQHLLENLRTAGWRATARSFWPASYERLCTTAPASGALPMNQRNGSKNFIYGEVYSYLVSRCIPVGARSGLKMGSGRPVTPGSLWSCEAVG